MAKPKQNQSTQPIDETPPETAAVHIESSAAAASEARGDITVGDPSSAEAHAGQTDDPAAGPEDFERHNNARLIEDHAADLVQIDALRRIEERARRREAWIARRTIEAAQRQGVSNPIVQIGAKRYMPKRGRNGGEPSLSEFRDRNAVTL